MNHLLILPILVPLGAAIALLAGEHLGHRYARSISAAATLSLVVLAIYLLQLASDGSYRVYALGDWPFPFGILLVLDRLSALMLAVTSVLALSVCVYSINGLNQCGKDFHVLFQVQLMGLNGAFLTGDLFNLFVFFEILLLASYSLLLHGGGPARSRAGLHYVVLNLVGSFIFLIALGLVYGVAGTLNLADLAQRQAAIDPQDLPLFRSAATLLLLVFAFKAALVPLHFWLPASYSVAAGPVAALFAIMTKVGVYAILRVFTAAFGLDAGGAGHAVTFWLLPLALTTVLIGAVGAFASSRLRALVAYLVLTSVGLLLTIVAVASIDAVAAGLYYLLHSTLVTGGLFLLADLIIRHRGSVHDELQSGPPLDAQPELRALFVLGAIAAAGLPPLSGFVGKLLTLIAALHHVQGVWIWSVILMTSMLIIVALARAGSILFWKTQGATQPVQRTPRLASTAAAALLLTSPVLTLFAGPVYELSRATAEQLLAPRAYIDGVVGAATQAAAGGSVP